MNKQNQDFQAMLGHFLDLYRIASFQFINPHSYTKFRQIKHLRFETQASTFVEVGTYLGVTTRRCARLFQEIQTIEIDPELAKKATEYLKSNKNIKVICGDALTELPKIFSNQLIQDTLVFLDGHYSGGNTGCGVIVEPAIEELKILSDFKEKINCIIIDDFRTFGSPGIPKKSEILSAAEQYFENFDLRIHLDQILLIRK